MVKRPNHVSKSWENPTNPQHQQAFVNIHDEEYGVTVGNFGLNEYEVTEDGQIAVTLLRSVGELGDWGYFPTPEAQCLGEHRFNYSMNYMDQKKILYLFACIRSTDSFSTQQIKHHEGTLISKQQYLTIKVKRLQLQLWNAASLVIK